MKTIARHYTMHAFGPTDQFVAAVEPGERFLVETSLGSHQPTGPIQVVGAEPGDILAVRVIDIKTVGDGEMWAWPGAGMLGEDLWDLIKDRVRRPVPIKGDRGDFGNGLTIALRPMAGVVGVAPPGRERPTYWPGRHGGNLDCNLIAPGATVYLPVYHSGAGLGIGDVHARIGDGEVMTSGLEVQGDVTVEVAVHRGRAISGPIVEWSEAVAVLASAKNLDAAGTLAVRRTALTIQSQTGLDFIAAGMLVSLIGDLGVVQAVDPLVTAKVTVRKSDLALDVLRHAV